MTTSGIHEKNSPRKNESATAEPALGHCANGGRHCSQPRWLTPPAQGGASGGGTRANDPPPTDRYLRVRQLLLASSLALASVVAGTAFAKSPEPSAPSPAAQADAAQRSPAANDAVQVVNAFMTALAGGRLEAARQLMTPDAMVLANGHVLGDRDTYINGAAKGDAVALGTVEHKLLRRDVKAGANLGWVVSETTLRQPNGASAVEVMTETMLLTRTADGWKITHIHWSGRHAG